MAQNHHFAVGTHSFLLLVETDGRWRLQDLQVLAKGHHYGIALPSAGGDAFVAKGRGELLTTYRRSASPGGVFVADDELPLPAEFGEIHQIAYQDGLFFLANTAHNSLVWMDAGGAVRGRYHFNGKNADIDHINSVFPLGAQQIVCLLHGRGRRPSQIAIMQRRGGAQIELLHLGFLRHFGCHNIYVDRQRLVYNASEAGKVVATDIESGFRRVLRFPGHTKGLSVLDQHYIVGYSDRVERARRQRSRGHLAVIRRDDLEVEAIIDLNHPSLPHPVGNVNEIRCLSHAEYSHHAADGEALAAVLRRLTTYSAASRLLLLSRLQAIRAAAIAQSFWQTRVRTSAGES